MTIRTEEFRRLKSLIVIYDEQSWVKYGNNYGAIFVLNLDWPGVVRRVDPDGKNAFLLDKNASEIDRF